jgi:hypothetical protein
LITAVFVLLFVPILIALETPRGRGKPYAGRRGYRRCSYCGMRMRLPLVASHWSIKGIRPVRTLVCHACWHETHSLY